DGGIAILIAEELAFRRLRRDLGDIAKPDRFAVAPRQHQAAEILGLVAAGVAQDVLLAADFDLAAGNIRGAGRACGDVGNCHAETGRLRHVDGDANLIRRAGIDDHLRYARHTFDARLDRVLD